MTSEASTCAICLEALFSEKPVGVTAPCGHCLHTECWDGWAASRLGSRDCKCPMCNMVAQSFVRLFVDLGAVGRSDDDDDDSLSLSSSSDDEELLDEEMTGDDAENAELPESDDTTEESPSSSSNNDALVAGGPVAFNYEIHDDDSNDDESADVDEEPNMIVIDDDNNDGSSETVPKRQTKRRKSSCEPSSSSSNSDGKKYKRMAKRLKKRVAMVESQRKQQGDEHRKLVLKFQAQRDELQSTKNKFELLDAVCEGQERTMEGLNLAMVRLRHTLDDKLHLLNVAECATRRAQNELRDEKENFQRKLALASAGGMKEVQRMKDERPKLVNEIRSLKEQLQRMNRRDTNSGAGDTTMDDKRKSNQNTQKEAKKFLRAVSDSRDNEAQRKSSAKQQKSRDDCDDNTEEAAPKKLTEHAARMRASVPKPGRKAPPSCSLAALDALDNVVVVKPLEPILPSFLQQPNATATSKNQPQKRRASASLSAAGSTSQRIRHTSALQQKKLDFRTMPFK